MSKKHTLVISNTKNVYRLLSWITKKFHGTIKKNEFWPDCIKRSSQWTGNMTQSNRFMLHQHSDVLCNFLCMSIRYWVILLLLLWIYNFLSKGSLSLASSIKNCPYISAFLTVTTELPNAAVLFREFAVSILPHQFQQSIFQPFRFREVHFIVNSVGYSAVSINTFSSGFFDSAFL